MTGICLNLRATLALVALGANLSSWASSPADTLRAALRTLAEDETEGNRFRLCAVSRFWRTPAYPAGSGPDYVNAAALLDTGGATPEAVLARLHAIEAAFGRTREARWAARGLDLDLLAMGDTIRPDAATQDSWRALPPADQARLAPETLILPHPRVQDRGFVLAPLAEIAPGWRHPRTGQTVTQMLAALPPGDLAEMRALP